VTVFAVFFLHRVMGTAFGSFAPEVLHPWTAGEGSPTLCEARFALERYFLEPYRFVPPFRSTFWVRLTRGLVIRQMRRKQGVVRWQFDGLEHFRRSLEQKAGILLAPNHCRMADPPLMGVMATQLKQYLYYIASYHLFQQSKWMGWFLNRLGGYSIWREGLDRESIKATTAILTEAERPVVIFPEGTWFRQNDRVGPLQDGLALITRQATRAATRPIVVHPVGIKYWMLHDPKPEIERRLRGLESRLGWSSQEGVNLLDRIEKLGGAFLALKEIEFLGQIGTGSLDDRIRSFANSQVSRLERDHLGKNFEGWILERIRRLRQQLARLLLDKAKEKDIQTAKLKQDLDDLLFCENLSSQSMEYVREDPSPERLSETIQRIEETLHDSEVPITPMGATVQVGEAMDVRSFDGAKARGAQDPLVQQLRINLQNLVDQLRAKGPPPAWNCPARTTSNRSPVS
jgi:1-acyl-sn-glycerol-3-phosphate acyltransferase